MLEGLKENLANDENDRQEGCSQAGQTGFHRMNCQRRQENLRKAPEKTRVDIMQEQVHYSQELQSEIMCTTMVLILSFFFIVNPAYLVS